MYTKKDIAFWIGVAVITVVLSFSMAFSRNIDESVYGDAEDYARVWHLIKDNYVEEISREKLHDGALKGMVEATGDRYATYMNAEETRMWRNMLDGQLVGVGVIISIRDGEVVVVRPIPDSPAEKAGIKPFDVIEKVDGTEIAEMPWPDIQLMIQGEVGTKVTLTVRSKDAETGRDVEIERAKIKTDYVTWGFVDDTNKIGYARLQEFSKNAADDLRAAIRKMKDDGMRGFVLDLRDNPGGLLDQAVEIADMFVEDGLIVSTRGRTSAFRSEYYAKKDDTLLGDAAMPMVLLVNGGSASASEVVAGALQDYARALIVGENTYGKFSVQQTWVVGEGMLKLTVAHYYTPKGRLLKDKLKPDREVVMANGDWLKMYDNRNKYESENGDKPYHGPDDTQLAAGIEYIAGQLGKQ